ncbi:hypothetical protein EWM64_g3031 [Hericium alpestre]|uniref:Uncharacterized protein n=1 Tax=Hericium alpestre TaxID=135208 RepID=A0A4Z0A3S3_9AGAM|nr:hypothetical protein EWM64_g3031 [Hericium alpestre]
MASVQAPQVVVAESIKPSSDTAAVPAPVPLSFPAFLRNPGLNNRYAHLISDDESRPVASVPALSKKSLRRHDNEGKRWVRRKDNGTPFHGKPTHRSPCEAGSRPSSPPCDLHLPNTPPAIPASQLVSSTGDDAPASNLLTAHAGRFGRTLRGMRRTLRKAGPRTQALVHGVETELLEWLQDAHVSIRTSADGLDADGFDFPGRAVGGQEGVREVERTPARLVWWIEDDAWARYVVHCCARYHEVVSFSKDTAEHRLTYLLRPNATRPDRSARDHLVTPPTTDHDVSSLSAYDSDLVSSFSDIQSDGLSDIISDSEHGNASGDAAPAGRAPLSDIASDVEADVEADIASERAPSRGSIGSLYHAALEEAEAWSVEGASDLDRAIDELSLQDDAHPDDTPSRFRRAIPHRNSVWNRTRSGSSPSRSPARRAGRRMRNMPLSSMEKTTGRKEGKSFFEYLFE